MDDSNLCTLNEWSAYIDVQNVSKWLMTNKETADKVLDLITREQFQWEKT